VKLMVGEALNPLRIACVNPEGMKAWARFLRDPNPIHLDPKAVAEKGLGDRVINQGAANLAYVISMLQRALPDSHLESLEVRYVDNVFGGEAVEASGKVLAIHGDGVMKITCEIWLRAETRGPVITGTATLAVAAS
jgi:3-hydroxybutyryl-CoA dehydratase